MTDAAAAARNRTHARKTAGLVMIVHAFKTAIVLEAKIIALLAATVERRGKIVTGAAAEVGTEA